MSNNIYWILELKINEGQLNAFRSLMGEMVEATQSNEPDALNYEWWISEDETTCHIYERYADSAALMTHLGNFGANFAERFMSMVVPTGFTVYGNANDTVKEALAAFGPTYMGALGGFGR